MLSSKEGEAVKQTDIVIVGAGFAGASTAYHLSRSFSGSILIIEKEEIPGFHASGRNAALVLQSTQHPDIRQVIVSSTQAYAQYRDEIGFEQHGSMLLGTRENLETLLQPELVKAEFQDPEQVRREIPLLKDRDFPAALFTPSDGIMDISALLQFYLAGSRSNGVDLWLNCELTEISSGKNLRLQTSRGTVETSLLINAAGAWATQVANLAGAYDLPMTPYKRHLFILDQIPEIDPTWPFVWDFLENFYFRPESGGLLFSICDEEKSQSLEPKVSPDISQSLAELVWVSLPSLRQATQRDVWSCFRTKTPDDSFLIGWDSCVDNFFWVAGLGGHGMGCSWEIGRRAASLLLDRESRQENPFDPNRFARENNNN